MPALDRARFPVTVDAPKTIALMSLIVTFRPEVETAPVKSLPTSSTSTSNPAADAKVVPPMISAPVLVIAPPAVTERLPVKVKA